MSSFLIVHSQPPGGRADRFAQPPMLDVSGFGARLDWGDTTFEVPPGDHRVAISVAAVTGGSDGAVVTVRVLPETGTRVSFAPPAAPGQPSTLRVDGQWPADAAMAYYAARDQRPLTPVAQPRPTAQPEPASPTPAVPPVGPSIGSTGSVPIVAHASSAPTFGQVQGAVVEPGAQQPRPQAPPPAAAQPHGGASAPPVVPAQQPGILAPPAFGPGAPQHPQARPGVQPAFGHQPIVRRDVYGRDRVDGDRSAPAIPTPQQFEDFARAERERHAAEAVAASRQQQGWYPDPYGRSDARWHDGERWTASVMRGGRRECDPV